MWSDSYLTPNSNNFYEFSNKVDMKEFGLEKPILNNKPSFTSKILHSKKLILSESPSLKIYAPRCGFMPPFLWLGFVQTSL